MGDPFESLEDRIKRLRPAEGAMPPVVAPTPIPPKAKTAASGSRAPPAFVFTRSDAPVIRHARRGSVAVAADALQQMGVGSLIGDLMEDRMAKSTTGPNASLVKTWTRFHHMAFDGEIVETSELMSPTPFGHSQQSVRCLSVHGLRASKAFRDQLSMDL